MKTSNEKPREQMTYVAPKTKLIEVKIEGVICNSFTVDGVRQGNSDWWEDEESE